jgi:nucleoside-diphosphate-sugar epimerase
VEPVTKHIILGAGGAIGSVLTNELLMQGMKVRLVSRRGQGLPGAESTRADLTDARQTSDAIENSAIVYLLAGLPYRTSIWQKQWPKIMHNVVAACQTKNARLVFFDNVYAYGRVEGVMTETTPANPCSKKGEVRAQIADYLMSEVRKGGITAIIARSADFYGPHADKTSVPFMLVFERLAKGRKAQWLVNPKVKHSYTNTEDCGKALYHLATTESAYNQVWHLPTASPALTGEEFVGIAAQKLGASPDLLVLKKWKIKLAGTFNPLIGELYEMLYQNEFDYVFDSSKFEKHFHDLPTPYETGIGETIDFFRRMNAF